MRAWEPAFAHLESERERERRRLERAMVRFGRLVDELAHETHTPVMRLAAILVSVDSRISERERAMVGLALIGTARASRVLEWFDASAYPSRVVVLKQICLGECRRRTGRVDARYAA